MKVVFADTGYWVAVINPHDHLHLKARETSQTLGQCKILTSEMVIDELLAVLSKPPQRNTVIKAVEKIISNPNVEVAPQSSIQFKDAFKMYRDHADKEWSLTDCASFLLMRSRGMQEALAHDYHFEQAGFIALLRQ